jgi:IclR family acetate operon transcriptional repressor
MPKSEGDFSIAVERALAIMESIAQRANGLTNAEISRKLEIPRSSASYILKTLEKTGYLRRERGTGKYLLGSKLFSLALALDAGGDRREPSRPAVRATLVVPRDEKPA